MASWLIKHIRSRYKTALQAMEEWQKEIRGQVEALTAPLPHKFDLVRLVRHWLTVNTRHRISSSELAEETKSWGWA